MSSEHDRSLSDSPPALVPESRGSVGFGTKPQLFHCSPGRPPPGHCCARFPDGRTLSPPTQGHRGKKGVWEQLQAPSSRELINESLQCPVWVSPRLCTRPLQSQTPLPPKSRHIPAARPHVYTALLCRAHSPPLVQHAGQQGKGVSLPSCPDMARSHGQSGKNHSFKGFREPLFIPVRDPGSLLSIRKGTAASGTTRSVSAPHQTAPTGPQGNAQQLRR